MKIVVWSDFACPFCYIAEKRLRKAISLLKGIAVDVEFKAFELDPYASRDVVSSTVDRFALKYRLSKDAAASRIEQISLMGRREGIDFKYASTQYSNTFDAHRLVKFAASKTSSDLVTALFDAYFTKNLVLSDHAVLKQIALDAGLDPVDVDSFLNSDSFAEDVRNDELDASRLGIHAVPYFVINDKFALSGAQPVNVLTQALDEAINDESTFNQMACGPDGCRFDV